MFKIILNTVFPNRCLQCNRIVDKQLTICNFCISSIDFTHFSYGEEHLFKQRCQLLFPTENAFALMYFKQNSLTREIIHALKYKGRQQIAEQIAQWCIPKLDFGNSPPDILIDVPLHAHKKKKRGYNQLHAFTDTLSRHYSIPYRPMVFTRNRNTKAQALKNKLGREKHQNLFSLNEHISHQHILLVDDVFTTGNTLSNLAWQLIEQDNTVSVLVMAWDY